MLCLSQTTGYAIQALSCLNESARARQHTAEVASRDRVSKPLLDNFDWRCGLSALQTYPCHGARGGPRNWAVTPDEIRRVVRLAVTARGFPSTKTALSWVEDVRGRK